MADAVEIRDGDLADAQMLMDLFDDAVAWLVTRGQTGQWGADPFSSRPDGAALVVRLSPRAEGCG
jgi:hypothetical protein